jgi:hypothetical protein
MTQLPYLVMDPAWLEQSLAWGHADARLLGARLRLLVSAWRGDGAMPSSHQYLSQTCGLPADVIAEHYLILTEGFELRGDLRLHHLQMEKMLGAVRQRHGEEIEAFALQTALATIAPDRFSLQDGVAQRGVSTIGKTMLPRGFGYGSHPELSNGPVKMACLRPMSRTGRWRFFSITCKRKTPGVRIGRANSGAS